MDVFRHPSRTEVMTGSITAKVRRTREETENYKEKLHTILWYPSAGLSLRRTASARQMLPGGSGPEGSAVLLEGCHQELRLNPPYAHCTAVEEPLPPTINGGNVHALGQLNGNRITIIL